MTATARSLCFLAALLAAPEAWAQPADGGVAEPGSDGGAGEEPTPPPPPVAPSEAVFFDRVLEFDRGSRDGDRHYVDATGCRSTPCVVTQHGALRFNVGAPGDFDIYVYVLHEGRITPVRTFESREDEDYKMYERIFNPHRNKRVWDLSERLNKKKISALYILGLVQQYRLSQGDPIAVEIRLTSRPEWLHTYYFRFHDEGVSLVPDVAFMAPLRIRTFSNATFVGPMGPIPKYGEVTSGAPLNLAGTLSWHFNTDPAVRYSQLQKFLHNLHPMVFAGPINIAFRETVVDSMGQPVLDTVGKPTFRDKLGEIDLFVGGGFSFLDFFVVGYGVNLFRTPHVGFPVLGISLVNLSRVLQAASRTASSDWNEFWAKEQERKAYPPPPQR